MVFEQAVAFAVRQRAFILVMVAAMAIFGVRAFLNLPIEAFPDVQDTQVIVVTQYPGQSPEEVERVVTLPIERELSGTARMTALRSVSITGLSIVTATFSDGTEDRFARSQIFEKLQGVTLPPGVQASLAPLTTAVGEIYRYVIEAPKDMPEREIRALQDWVIRPALRQAEGVADVVSMGGTIKAYQIEVDPLALKRYGLSLSQVTDAVAANNVNGGGGVLKRGNEGLVLRAVGVYRTLDELRNVVLEANNGRAVLLSDVAQVSIGDRPRSGMVAYNDRDSVVQGVVQMLKAGNAARVVEGVRAQVDKLNDGRHLPPGVKIHPTYQRTDLINHTVETVGENLLVGALLVVSVLIIFLRSWSASLIVASVIPLTLLFAFILIDARGVSANLISLGAVDFGILIDSAVVIVEALMVRLSMQAMDAHPGMQMASRRTALRQTVASLGRPVLFSKAIIILAFLPIFTFQRVEGKIFSPVAFTLAFALAGAVLLTLTLVPALLSWRLDRGALLEAHLGWMQWMQDRYRALLQWSCGHAKTVMLGVAGAMVLALSLIPAIGTEFLPKLDEGNIWLTISLPPASSLEQTKEIERAVRARLLPMPEVKQVITQIGRPDDGTDPKGPNNLELLIDLKPRDEWRFAVKEQLVEVMSAKLEEIPGLPTNFSQVIQDNAEESMSGVKGEIAVKIFGPDLDILEEKAEQVESVLRGVRGATDVAAIKVSGQAELTVVPDRRKLARYGISTRDVSEAVQVALGGYSPTAFYEGDRRFDVVVRLSPESRNSISDIGNLQIDLPGPGAATVPLSEVADITVREGASRILRELGGRNASIKANLIGRDQGSFVAEAMREVSAKVALPPGYTMTWGGQFENQQRAMKRLSVIVPISLLAIFALLFWNFRSMTPALVVLASAPLTLIGGFIGLALAGLHLSVSAAVGFIAVSGISVQNGVIMVEEMIALLNNGASFGEAVLDGAVRRLRPVLMTALMAGLGLLPAALSHGIGSETQRPFAVVIVGGVISATLFGLLVIPTLMARFAAPPVNDD